MKYWFLALPSIVIFSSLAQAKAGDVSMLNKKALQATHVCVLANPNQSDRAITIFCDGEPAFQVESFKSNLNQGDMILEKTKAMSIAVSFMYGVGFEIAGGKQRPPDLINMQSIMFTKVL